MGGGYTPKYITTGLWINSDRCIINDGGYYIDSNNIVHVDITITFLVSLSDPPNFDVNGFPNANAATPSSGVTAVTGSFNKLAMGVSYYSYTTLYNTGAVAVGEQLHFIGSYQMKVV